MKYSVVIPTRNREDQLKQCVESVKQSLPKDTEIIVIRDLGKSEARNAGIAKARGEIITFIDDDCVADPLWLTELVKCFDDPAIGIVIGTTIYRHRRYRGRFPERIVQNFGRWPGAGNIAYRKKVFQTAGGFDPFFDHYNNEDTEMAIRAVSRGFRAATAPRAIVFHQPTYWDRRSLLASLKNSFVWPILKKRYPRHWDAFGAPPRHYLVQACLMLMKWIMLPLFHVVK